MRCIQTGNQRQRRLYLMSPINAIFFPSCLLALASCLLPLASSLLPAPKSLLPAPYFKS
ncbi:MAG: hypothetical protein F6K55_06700 [Moorea sp. SIO4A3]|nr:hypothetical protein [Moorena sp. SIO4A3]